MTLIDIEQPESLQQARNWLQYVRRSSPPGAPFTLSQDIVTMYGKPKPRRGKPGRRPKSTQEHPERALLSYALAIANEETDVSEMWRAILAGEAGLIGKVERVDSSVSRETQAATYLQGVKEARERLSVFLELVCTNRRAARTRFDVRSLDRVWALPEVHDGRLTHHLLVLDLQAFEALVCALLLDESKGRDFGRDLRRCQAKSCRKFFFRELTGGRPRDTYHDGPCYDIAHDKERVRRSKVKQP